MKSHNRLILLNKQMNQQAKIILHLFNRYWGMILLTITSVAMIFLSAVSIADQIAKPSTALIPIPAPVNKNDFTTPANLGTRTPYNPPMPPNAISPIDVKVYVVQPGDSLITIASKLGTNEELLKRINNVPIPREMNIGQPLLYYTPSGIAQ